MKEIKVTEIQQGDTIRVTSTSTFEGVTTTAQREGTVARLLHTVSGFEAYTEEWGKILSNTDSFIKVWLLERPTPAEPGIGGVVKFTYTDDDLVVSLKAVRSRAGDTYNWVVYWVSTGDTYDWDDFNWYEINDRSKGYELVEILSKGYDDDDV